MCDEAFITEAIRRAEERGLYPADCQRPVDWRAVREWARRVREPGFRWLPVSEQRGAGFIIVGSNGAIASGQHRILGGLMGDNPVPEESITRIGAIPARPWRETLVHR